MASHEPNPPNFGDLLRRARLAAGFTQEELAERAGLSVRGISDLERGTRRTPQRATLDLLMDCLNLSEAERIRWERVRRFSVTAGRSRSRTSSRRAAAQPKLPNPLTSIIGRAGDITAVVTLLRDPLTRLVTLVGAGGIGKTRLSIAVAHEVAHDYPDGAVFVSLAAIRDPDLVIPAIARELALRTTGSRSVSDDLRVFLQDRRVLLILDNLEQVTDAAPEIVEILEHAIGVTVLATSRARLRVRGEREYLVRQLVLPSADCTTLDALKESTSGQLFLQCARDAAPQVQLTDTDVPSIVHICRRLDGLPLAIELATARLRLVSPEELADLLSQRLPILTGGPGDLPARQRALRDTIRWSYDLLTPGQQQLLRSLSVCAGGWTIEAAAAIAGAETVDLLGDLTALIDQSLIHPRVSTSGASRLGMLETIRAFAIEQLQLDPRAAAVRTAHARYYLVLAEAERPRLEGPERIAALDRLDQEVDNFRAALEWSIENRDDTTAIRLAGALGNLWWFRGDTREGRRWLDTILADPTMPLSVGSWEAHYWRAAFLMGHGELDAAAQTAEHFLTWSTESGDELGTAIAHLALGNIELNRGDEAAARAHLRPAYDFLRQHNYTWAPLARTMLGHAAYQSGDLDEATAHYEDALAQYRSHQLVGGSGFPLRGLGHVARQQGDLDAALRHYQAALAVYRDEQSIREIGNVLACIAAVCCAAGQPGDAAMLLGAVERCCEQSGLVLDSTVQQVIHDAGERARSALGVAEYEARARMGGDRSVRDVVEHALALKVQPASPQRQHPAGLSTREVEVLRLVAQGLTDAQVAERLFLSRRTVSTHLTSIYTKLGVTSRTAATRFALEHGLT